MASMGQYEVEVQLKKQNLSLTRTTREKLLRRL